jgi:hypothetical protein
VVKFGVVAAYIIGFLLVYVWCTERNLIILAFGSSNNAFPDDGDCTETCRSCLNVNFNVNLKLFLGQFACASVGE